MTIRRRKPFRLEFDTETLGLLRLEALDPRGPGPTLVGSRFPTLVTVIRAVDEASARRDHDFKGIALVARAEREALRELFEDALERLPDREERRAMQLCMSSKSPKRTIEEAAAEMGCDVGLLSTALSHLFIEVARGEPERQISISGRRSFTKLLRRRVGRLVGRKP
jgi:hypothetical protein